MEFDGFTGVNFASGSALIGARGGSAFWSLQDMEIANVIPEMYPDLIEQGGLANALHLALRKVGSSLSVAEFDKSVPFVVQARVELEERFSQIYIGCATRMFTFDF